MMNPRLAPAGALAHVARQPPGQQPGVQALVEWNSLGPPGTGGSRRRATPQAASVPAMPMVATGATVPTQPASMTGVEAVAPARLGWLAADARPHADDWLWLGSLAPWTAFDDALQWFDLVASLQRGGAWHDLPLDLSFDAPGAAAGSRIDVGVAPHDVHDLRRLGVDPDTLQAALGNPDCTHWVTRRDGLGVFVALLIDLGWP